MRKAKRRVEGFTAPENIKKAQDELKEAQKKLREFIGQTNADKGATVLKSDQGRETTYGAAELTEDEKNAILKIEKEQRRIQDEIRRIREEVIPNLPTDKVVSKQKIHRQGTKEYTDRQIKLAVQNKHGPSYVVITDDEILELVNKHKGTGVIKLNRNLKWDNKETIITNDELVGCVVNDLTGETAKTSVFKIHYSKNGIHIVPDYPSKKKV